MIEYREEFSKRSRAEFWSVVCWYCALALGAASLAAYFLYHSSGGALWFGVGAILFSIAAISRRLLAYILYGVLGLPPP